MPFASFQSIPSPTTPPDIASRDIARQADLSALLATMYPEPVSLVYELGCGHGHLLSAYATAHPSTQCLGVDLVTKRIDRALRKQSRLGLKNLAFLKANAIAVLAALPEHVKLAGIFVLFPDPWPKKRHHRRRLLQTELLDALAARALSDAWLAVRSDEPSYFDWVSEQINTHPSWRLTPQKEWAFEHITVFQEMQGAHQSLMAVKK